MNTLRDVKIGDTVKVVKLHGDGGSWTWGSRVALKYMYEK